MRKFLASILVLAMALTSFSMVAFAAATDVYFGAEGVTEVTATEDTYTVEVYYNPASHAMEYDGEYYIGAFGMTMAVTDGVGEIAPASIEGLASDVSSTKLVFSAEGDGAILTGAVKVADITVTRAEGAKTSVLTLSEASSSDFDGDYYPTAGSLTITWPSNEPQPIPNPGTTIPTTYTAADGTVYNNVVNTTVAKAAPASGSINGEVVATYWKDGVTELLEKHFGFSGIEITGEGGTVTFNVAITNVPSYVTVTAVDVALGN